MIEQREHWGSKAGFILAAAGSAIGLGNIWKFPYIAGENGGAAFIFIYLICIALIGLPVLIAEILLGRSTQRNPVGAFKKLSGKPFWVTVGSMGVLAGFIILSFYTVIAGWSIGYIIEALKGSFSLFSDPSIASSYFDERVSDVSWIVGYHTLFSILTMLVVYAGVNKGIEKGSKIMMPVLFFLLVLLVIRGVTLPGADKGLAFLWSPDWSKISGQSVLIALGHAFFTISLGMGAMMTYGSYLSQKDHIPSAAIQIVFLDTLIALLAGVAIFTAVFAMGQDPASGPGLIFVTLPVVFAKMPGGVIWALLFFLLLTLAALTSAISLLEVVVAYFVDERKWKRHKAVLIFGFVTFLIGVPSALSFNIMSDVHFFGKTWFDNADYLASNILLPGGGLFISIFVGWIWGFDKVLIELKKGSESLFDNYPLVIKAWKIFLKYLSPVMILIVFLHSVGLLESAMLQFRTSWVMISLALTAVYLLSKRSK
ncbi:MAG: sodium-dependent transporter [Candidatus Marinimicrobia bacterium]|nr:sodium-dependent transporter [Candidatus Neomarinimicrobiota bacterium]